MIVAERYLELVLGDVHGERAGGGGVVEPDPHHGHEGVGHGLDQKSGPFAHGPGGNVEEVRKRMGRISIG